MSDFIKGVYVAFEKDFKEEDAKIIINTIGMIKGVVSVKALKSKGQDWINREQERIKLVNKLLEVLEK